MTAILRDEALPEIIKLTQQYRDEQSVQASVAVDAAHRVDAASPSTTDMTEEQTRTKLKASGAGELLNRVRWDSYPEKILLLAAWVEANAGKNPWRCADMEEAFRQAKEKSPGNFPRDIKNAIKAGWIHAVTPRTYSVTRTGWSKIGEALAS